MQLRFSWSSIHFLGMAADLDRLITLTPEVRNGKATLAGTRFTVSYVLEFLASVMSEEDVLRDFPDLRMGQIQVVMRHSSKGEKKPS
jgi:uncharacterized protein (DUF433 family)